MTEQTIETDCPYCDGLCIFSENEECYAQVSVRLNLSYQSLMANEIVRLRRDIGYWKRRAMGQ